MMEQNQNWKLKTLIIGAAVGAVTGLLAGYIMVSTAEQHNSQPRLSAGEGVKVGLGVLGLMRLIAEFAKPG
jgi:hypothetical protein